MKDELFDNFIFEFNFKFWEIIWHPKYLIIFQIVNIDFPNGRMRFLLFSELLKFFKIVNYSKFVNCYIISKLLVKLANFQN